MYRGLSIAGAMAGLLLLGGAADPAAAASMRLDIFSASAGTTAKKSSSVAPKKSASVTAKKRTSLLSSSRIQRARVTVSRQTRVVTRAAAAAGTVTIKKPQGGVLGSTGTPGGPTSQVGITASSFTDIQGGNVAAAIPTTSGNTSKLVFGGATSMSKSFFQFMGADPLNFALPLDGTVDFALGNLYHFNGQVTEGSGISNAKLNFTLRVGSAVVPLTIDLYHFDKNGEAADLLSLLTVPTDVLIPAGAISPTVSAVLSVLGFDRSIKSLNRQTNEGDTGEFTLFGRLTVTPVPVPAALPLFATGVAGVALWSRRQKQRRQAAA